MSDIQQPPFHVRTASSSNLSNSSSSSESESPLVPLVPDPRQTSQTTAMQRSQSVGPFRDFPLQYHASVIVFESFNLASFLFHGTPRWIAKLCRLMLFVTCLLPAFIVFACYYMISSDRVVAGYAQGRKKTSRHYLDVYGATSSSSAGQKPVVIFLTGGAWIIGYKMWGALLARALVRAYYMCSQSFARELSMNAHA